MTQAILFEAGGYRYVPGPFQYSGGVAAAPGYRIDRARFRRPLPVTAGFEAIEAYLAGLRRPLTAFCACELRSPAPFTDEGFRSFNRVYVGTLERWGIFRDEANPVARSNVCPEVDPPPEPGFVAFSYTVPVRPAASEPLGASSPSNAAPTFVVAGSGEAPEGEGSYRDRIVHLDDTSPDGLREKARFVLGEMERRMSVLGVGWADATATQVYTVHDLHPSLAEEIVVRGAAAGGLVWHFARPPVQGLDFEMDVRGVALERVL